MIEVATSVGQFSVHVERRKRRQEVITLNSPDVDEVNLPLLDVGRPAQLNRTDGVPDLLGGEEHLVPGMEREAELGWEVASIACSPMKVVGNHLLEWKK